MFATNKNRSLQSLDYGAIGVNERRRWNSDCFLFAILNVWHDGDSRSLGRGKNLQEDGAVPMGLLEASAF